MENNKAKATERMMEQYWEIAEAKESEGLGYAIYPGGYIEPNTDDEELNEAIRDARRGLKNIDSILTYFGVEI